MYSTGFSRGRGYRGRNQHPGQRWAWSASSPIPCHRAPQMASDDFYSFGGGRHEEVEAVRDLQDVMAAVGLEGKMEGDVKEVMEELKDSLDGMDLKEKEGKKVAGQDQGREVTPRGGGTGEQVVRGTLRGHRRGRFLVIPSGVSSSSTPVGGPPPSMTLYGYQNRFPAPAPVPFDPARGGHQGVGDFESVDRGAGHGRPIAKAELGL